MRKQHADDENLCVVTVTTDSFVVGTLVTLDSFLKNNSWFAGEVVIVCNELSEQNRELLKLIYDKITFLKASNELLRRIAGITETFPDFTPKQARYYSLETFRLRDYKRVLFLDSDLLFRGSIRDLFELENEFIACGDGAFYNNRGRRWGSGIEDETEIHVLRDTFNSGLFLVDDSLLTDEIYNGLLELVDPRIYKTPNMRLTDQVILNLYFANRQHLASGKYNYLLTHRNAIFEREKINLQDAIVLHFNGQQKPWMTQEILAGGLSDAVFLKACGLWFKSYTECLQRLHLRTNTKNFQDEKI
jgi:lipopolysaccharide biosynthesis glycosyltransferase